MRRRKWILLVLMILMVCFIWGNSMMPGSISYAFSDWAGGILSRFFRPDAAETTERGIAVLRKAAHVTEYAALGALLRGLLRSLRGRNAWCILLLCGLAAAALDETIQLFSDGRSSQITDVGIDLCGFCLGALLCTLGIRLYRRRKKQ